MSYAGVVRRTTQDNDDTETTTPADDRERSESDCNSKRAANPHSWDEDSRGKTRTDSEHGHSLIAILPMTKHRGSSVSNWFNGLFTTIIGVATLGTSITFSYVLSNGTATPPSTTATFNQQQVQDFLAISWLLFLLTLAFASLGSTLLTFFKKHWIADWDGVKGETSQWTVQMYAVCVSGLLGALTIGAFMLLCLVVVAYSPVVGWVSLFFAIFFGVVILVAVVHQAPWPWRDNTPSLPA
ncbi:hypothetical protein EDD37DRAFT_570851 [Exophiala viscosa]|uniref:uncharacterized protein n=1 Tax=Exophiala viscosa TaxID=2486360 RepID=UPI002191A9B1|nr:hypothetical protein EDD37DRAFT_570851 [Exophiala viscosa]